MDLIFLVAAFIGGCFAGGFINHWMISSGVSAGLSSLEVKVGNLQATVANKVATLKPATTSKS
jgi:hypothetical protein